LTSFNRTVYIQYTEALLDGPVSCEDIDVEIINLPIIATQGCLSNGEAQNSRFDTVKFQSQ